MEKTVLFKINEKPVSFNVYGETGYGSPEVLLEKDDNLIAQAPWNAEGYHIASFILEEDYQKLVSGIQNLVWDLLQSAGVQGLQDFALEKYHHFAPEPIHREVIRTVQKCFPIEQFPIDKTLVAQRVSEVCGVPVTTKSPTIGEVFCIRIVRPFSNDNNPPHRDVWLNYYRNVVNIYVPLAGSDENSSLPLVPRSHYWQESDIERTLAGAKIGEYTYHVPSVTGALKNMDMVRPNPRRNEVLVFSPYLIHGGGYNLNSETTRVSLEMRFWRKQPA